MSLDFPASGDALWAVYDKTGIRPEYLLPVLFTESGFNPAVPNQAGAPFYGINQISGAFLQARGIDPGDYLTWPASRQLREVVLPYMQGEVESSHVIPASGTRTYQMNFLPGTLGLVKKLAGILAVKGNSSPVPGGGVSQAAVYDANAGLDFNKSGAITLGSLAHFIGKAASNGAVQNAIASTYAERPGEAPRDPVLGTDFQLSGWRSVGVAVGVTGAIALGLYLLRR